jgi:hypothetical protein
MSITTMDTCVGRTIGTPTSLLRSPQSKLERFGIEARIYTKIKHRLYYLSLDLLVELAIRFFILGFKTHTVYRPT